MAKTEIQLEQEMESQAFQSYEDGDTATGTVEDYEDWQEPEFVGALVHYNTNGSANLETEEVK